MVLFGKRQPIPPRGQPIPPRGGGFQRPFNLGSRFRKPVRNLPSPPRKMGYTRSEVRGLLRGAWKGSRLNPQQRIGLEKELFPYQKYGSHISGEDLKSALQNLRRAESRAKTSAERAKISRQRKTLEGATGFKGKY